MPRCQSPFPIHSHRLQHLHTGGVLSYMRISGWIKLKDEDTYIDEVVGIALACCGFYFQTQMAWVRTRLGIDSTTCFSRWLYVAASITCFLLTLTTESAHRSTGFSVLLLSSSQQQLQQKLPFPINVLLLPLTLLETTLSYYVAS